MKCYYSFCFWYLRVDGYYRVIIITHLICIGFYMNKSPNPIYMVVNKSIIKSRTSKKKGLQYYKLFNSNKIMGFLQISSTQPTPNNDEERESWIQPSYHRGCMSMSTPIVWMIWRSYPQKVKPKAGGKLKNGQLNHLIQAEKGRNDTSLKA